MKLHNKRHTRLRIAALAATVAAVGGLAVMATGVTGAFFSDTASGTVNGTIGTVHEATSGGTGADQLDLSFVNLMPGVPQTVTANFANDTGSGLQDFYITFPNATALSALNNLGNFGTLHISSAGQGAVGDVFDSQNLNDNGTSCPVGSTSVAHPFPCAPLPNQLLIASNVGPGQGGQVSIQFNYASALGGSKVVGGGTFNTYPVTGQTTIVGTDGSGSGLPYNIVTTQPGVAPGAPGTKP
jgi:hypothetical protein